MAQTKYVTLVATDNISPYNKGEVFTVSEAEAEMLLNVKGVDENGKARKVKVERYKADNKEHLKLLEAQRGKPTNPATGEDLTDEELAKRDDDAAKAEKERRAEAKKAEAKAKPEDKQSK